MPHFDQVTTEFLTNPSPAVSPIVGNTEHGSAAYDPQTGQALYAVYHDDAFRLFRTTGGYRQLVLQDDSVEEVAVIVDGPFGPARNIGLTWIGGVLYATVVGVDLDTVADRAGMWIYRATNLALTSWTQHGTVHEMAPSTVPLAQRSSSALDGVRWGGEIFVHSNGVWSLSHHYMVKPDVLFADAFIDNKAGISTSSDSGATWEQQFNIAEAGTAVDGIYDESIYQYSVFNVHNGSTSFGEFGGYAYAGWLTNSGREFHFRSNDGTWSKLGNIGAAGNDAFKWPFSIPGRLYSERADIVSYTESDPALMSYTSTGVDLNDYGLDVNAEASTHFCNIHTALTPYLIATKYGEIVGVGQAGVSGWRLWVSET